MNRGITREVALALALAPLTKGIPLRRSIVYAGTMNGMKGGVGGRRVREGLQGLERA